MAATTQEKADLADAGRLRWVPVGASASGYVQGIDEEDLLAFARGANAVVHMEQAIGSFVVKGSPLVSVASYASGALNLGADVQRRLNGCYSIGRQRTIEQDAGFGLRQLEDIALKALSAGINDTSTAVMCIDWLGALVALLAQRDLGSPVRAEDRQVRVLALRPDFASYLRTAFDQVRTNAATDEAIYQRLLAALRTVALRTSRPAYRQALRQQADLALAAAGKNLPTEHELAQVRRQHQQVLTALVGEG